MLINAFINRGFRQEVVVNIAKKIPWASREYYRQRALGSKAQDIPGGGAIFTTTIDPAVQAALKAGLHIDLTRVQATPTAGTDEEVQQALGRNLTAIFPSTGAIAEIMRKAAQALANKKVKGQPTKWSWGAHINTHSHIYIQPHTHISHANART